VTSSPDFETLVTAIARPMLVVTTVAGNARAGCLVGFHCQCSIEPPGYAVWLSKANRTFEIAMLADRFALHFLDEGDLHLAELFGTVTGDDEDKFEQCAWHPGADGVPLLDDCTVRMDTTRVAIHDSGGDHVCFVLAPRTVALSSGDVTPLESTALGDLSAGHAADDRRTRH
jgi:flavin reductase (DIM6/NTAB) family NADH-FMN oxidoreductase RutF